MIQSTLLVDSSSAMGLPCAELPPTKAIGLRPHLAAFVTSYLSSSPLALLSIVRMRDGTATTIAPFSNNADSLLEALETKFFMMPPSGMMSLENGLRLSGYNMQLDSTGPPIAAPTLPSITTPPPAGSAAPIKVEGGYVPEAEARMDRTDIECALQEAIRQEEAMANGRGGANPTVGVKREREEGGPNNQQHTTTTNTGSAGAVAQRRIIVVTGAVSVLDPTNVYSVIDALVGQQVVCDVVCLSGAPHILVELCRRTKGLFLCPMSGGGEQLRRHLLSCAQLKSRHRRSQNAPAPPMELNWGFGGPFQIASQGGENSNFVAIGFPVLLNEVGEGDSTTNNDLFPPSSQPLCPRCYNPIAIPSVCSICGLLTCALPQIHKAFLSLDQGLGGHTTGQRTKNTPTLPTILAPSQYVTLEEHKKYPSEQDLRTRCACCGRVMTPPSSSDAMRGPSDEVLVSACQCSGCGGIRCLDCDAYVKASLFLCPTCVGC